MRMLGNNLIWYVFDKLERKSTWTLASDDAFQLLKCLSEIPQAERASYIKDFAIMPIFDQDAGKLLSVSIAKRGAVSILDPSKIIDKDTWAVTLISSGYSSGILRTPIDSGCGHAKIIYEGFKNGCPFTGYVHLTRAKDSPSGYATVKTERMETHVDVLDRKKSLTWSVSRTLVEALELEAGQHIPFNVTGNRNLTPSGLVDALFDAIDRCEDFICSFFQEKKYDYDEVSGRMIELETFEQRRKKIEKLSRRSSSEKEYNCLTWAKDKLLNMGIYLPEVDTALAAPDDYIENINLNPSLIQILKK